MATQVRGHALSDGDVVSEQTNGSVAEVAKQVADDAGLVVMIDREAPTILIGTFARCADASLRVKERIVLLDRHSIASLQPRHPRPPLLFLRMGGKPTAVTLKATGAVFGVRRISLAAQIDFASLATTAKRAVSIAPELARRLRFLAVGASFCFGHSQMMTVAAVGIGR